MTQRCQDPWGDRGIAQVTCAFRAIAVLALAVGLARVPVSRGGVVRDRIVGMEIAARPHRSTFVGVAVGATPGVFRAVVAHGVDPAGGMGMAAGGGGLVPRGLWHGHTATGRGRLGLTFTGPPVDQTGCGIVRYPLADRLASLRLNGRRVTGGGRCRGGLVQYWTTRLTGQCAAVAARVAGVLTLVAAPAARGGLDLAARGSIRSAGARPTPRRGRRDGCRSCAR